MTYRSWRKRRARKVYLVCNKCLMLVALLGCLLVPKIMHIGAHEVSPYNLYSVGVA